MKKAIKCVHAKFITVPQTFTKITQPLVMQTAHFWGLFKIDNFPAKLTTNPVNDSQHDYIRQNSEYVDLFLVAHHSTFVIKLGFLSSKSFVMLISKLNVNTN